MMKFFFIHPRWRRWRIYTDDFSISSPTITIRKTYFNTYFIRQKVDARTLVLESKEVKQQQ